MKRDESGSIQDPEPGRARAHRWHLMLDDHGLGFLPPRTVLNPALVSAAQYTQKRLRYLGVRWRLWASLMHILVSITETANEGRCVKRPCGFFHW